MRKSSSLDLVVWNAEPIQPFIRPAESPASFRRAVTEAKITKGQYLDQQARFQTTFKAFKAGVDASEQAKKTYEKLDNTELEALQKNLSCYAGLEGSWATPENARALIMNAAEVRANPASIAKIIEILKLAEDELEAINSSQLATVAVAKRGFLRFSLDIQELSRANLKKYSEAFASEAGFVLGLEPEPVLESQSYPLRIEYQSLAVSYAGFSAKSLE